MFICNECLKENFTNGESLFKSGGSCEICNEKKVCNEIQSSRLKVRVKPLEPVKLDQDGTVIELKPVMRDPQVNTGIIPRITKDGRLIVPEQLIMDFDE